MKNPLPYLAITSSLLLTIPNAQADLPQLAEKPWLGYFLGMKDKKMQFGIDADGDGIILPLKRDGEPSNIHNPIKLSFDVLETTPDGKVVRKQVKADTLASTSPAVKDPKQPITITGKVTGDASFAAVITAEPGGFSVSGKITDKGTLTNPLKFEVSIDFNPYPYGGGATKDTKDNFEKKIKRDEIKATLADKKRAKLDFADEKNPAEAFKGGVAELEIKTEGYGGVGFELTATDKSKITFEDKGSKTLWSGFSLQWSVNEGADPGTQKLTFSGK